MYAMQFLSQVLSQAPASLRERLLKTPAVRIPLELYLAPALTAACEARDHCLPLTAASEV
jgi:hypothetical protein